MSEPAASYRPLSGAEEFDRRVRSIAQTQPPHADVFAELARLVDQHDPFSERGAARNPPFYSSEAAVAEPGAGGASAHDTADAFQGYPDAGEEPGTPVEPAVVHASVPAPEPWERAVPRYPSIAAVRDPRPVEPSPDVWAQGVDGDAVSPTAGPAVAAARDPAETANPKRTLIVLAAVVLLTGGGLVASFLAKPSAGTVSASAASTPTIMAATGPTKVQPEAPASGADAPSEPSTLLDKGKNDGTAAAKVVNTVEQPVDLSQAIKPSPTPDAAEATAAPSSAFPEPRKVKTVLVRPDGSIIADASTAAVSAAVPAVASNQQASLAFDPHTALPVVSPSAPPVQSAPPMMPDPVVAMPDSTPPVAASKTTTRATSRPAASTTQAGSPAAQAKTAVATPKAKPAAPVAKSKPKPVAAATPDATVADATPAAAEATTAGSGGGYAIQLGAAPSEAEGQTAATRLGQKYAGDLGGATPTIHKATAGTKTVYRIRVGNLSQEAAKAMCAKVAAGGGGCFVARN